MYKICTRLSSFGQKIYGQKVLNILPFRFFIVSPRFFDDSVRAFSVLNKNYEKARTESSKNRGENDKKTKR